MPDTIKYTVCGYHCFNSCILKVRIRQGKIFSIEPDDTIGDNIPREDGYVADEAIDRNMVNTRPCARGFVHPKILLDPNRVMAPMKRVGERGEGKFERISWDEALDTIAGKLLETKKKYGPLSILGSGYGGGGGFPLAPWFGAGVVGWGSHSTQGVAEPEWWVTGRPQIRQDRQDESNLLKAKLIVLWGFNPATTLAAAATYTMMRAKERGIPIVSIEQRLTSTAGILADQWIPIRPTTDTAMMVAMANVWFKEDLCDKEAIEKWVEPEGLKRWKDYVLGADDGIDKTPQWAEKVCAVPAETITEFARLYARSKPVNLHVSYSLGRQFYGENAIRAAIYLQALTGNVCTPGATASAEAACEFGYRWGNWSLPKPVVMYPKAPGTYRPPVRMVHFKWPVAVALRDKFESGEISLEQYCSEIGTVPGNEPPNIRMVILEMDDSLMTHPDMNTTIKAFKKLDFLVNFSNYATNPQSKFADILLPQIAIAYEGIDMGDPFTMGWNLNGNFFGYKQKCIDPPGDIKPWGWIWTQIAKRLGIAELYNPTMANVPDDKWDETILRLHQEAYEKWMKREEIVPLNPPTWEEFQKKPVFRWEIKEPYYTYKAILERGDNPFKATESGKIEFYNKELAKGPDYLAKNEFKGSGKSAGQDVHNAGGKWYGPGNLPPMAKMVVKGKTTYHSNNVIKYPLLLSTPQPLFRSHSLLDNQPLLNQDCYRHAVWISVPDAKKRGIKDNDMVKVYNDIAEMVLPAYVTSRIVPGVAVMFHGGWYQPGKEKTTLMPEGIDMRGSANFLTHHDEHFPETILDHVPCKGLVEVEKWKAA